jgi:hypothetical protein
MEQTRTGTLIQSALFERVILYPPKVTPLVTQRYSDPISVFRDAYAFEFLDLPASHAEAELHRGLLSRQRLDDCPSAE